MATTYLDAKGLLCPLPVLRARKALKRLDIGDVLVVETTDDAAPADMAAFCTATGERLLRSERGEGGYRFEIERAAGVPRAES